MLAWSEQVSQAMQSEITSSRSLHGGCIGDVYKVELADKRQVVVKVDTSSAPRLDVEGFMLTYLKTHSPLPVPEVYHSSSSLLVMEFIPGESRFNAQSQEHAAELLATLHQIQAPQHGFERDTLIGSLVQPNAKTDSWLDFFREQRILYMARQAFKEKTISHALLQRLESFCDQLDQWLPEPTHPALLHGDVWTTNVLAKNNRITGFIDPAIYYGHPEIELAFSTLFGTFGEPFFRRYEEISPLEQGFFEIRRDLYNLYPLLVHVRLFGRSYISAIETTLHQVGC